jgi:hypothetical protein
MREHGGWWADLVHQAYAEQAVRGHAAGEQCAIDVAQRFERGRDKVDVARQEVGDLLVRIDGR